MFPPEDLPTIAALNREFHVGAEENACTRHEFARMCEARAVRFAQPSVTKVGGVTEFVAAAGIAAQHGVSVMPHSPYFGPGYHATLHLAAVLSGEVVFEHLYVQPAADIALHGTPLPCNGVVAVPDVPAWDSRRILPSSTAIASEDSPQLNIKCIRQPVTHLARRR